MKQRLFSAAAIFIVFSAITLAGCNKNTADTPAPANTQTGAQTAAAHAPADITITTVPPQADVFFDGKPVGKSPAEIKNVSEGTHQVRVVKEKYKELIDKVEVSGEGIKVFFFRLKE